MRIGGKWVLLLMTVSLLWMCLWPLGALSKAGEQTPPPPPAPEPEPILPTPAEPPAPRFGGLESLLKDKDRTVILALLLILDVLTRRPRRKGAS